jgi:hypothetical protein
MSDTSSVSSYASSHESLDSVKIASRELTYMTNLKKVIVEKRGVTESTAAQTLQCLLRLNGGRGFTSLAFLADVDAIRTKVEKDHTDVTQKSYYSRILCALGTTESKRYAKPQETYKKLFEGKVGEIDTATKKRGTALTEKEAAVWMSWSDIITHYEKVGKEVKAILKKPGELSSVDYDRVQDHLLLTLFTQMAPRRNKDYSAMFITRKKAGDDKTKNYYVLEEGKMYFNVYKTAKKHGQQIVDVPENVQSILSRFLKLTAMYRQTRGRAPMMPLICNYQGAHVDNVTKMTLFLNRAFGKKISCNIIRHSYISSLYTPAVLKMGETAAAMGHGRTCHLSYFRTPIGGAGTADSDSDVGSVIDLV